MRTLSSSTSVSLRFGQPRKSIYAASAGSGAVRRGRYSARPLWPRASILLFAAGFTDVIDGFLARRFGQPTRVRRLLRSDRRQNPAQRDLRLARRCAGAFPWWMVAVVFGRDVLILGMAAYGLLFTSVRKFPPSVWGKISTFFQIAAALVVMGARAGIPAPVTSGPLAQWSRQRSAADCITRGQALPC